MYAIDLQDGSIEYLQQQSKYYRENSSELHKRPENMVKKVFEETTDYKVGRADSRSQYISLDDRMKAAFRNDYGESLYNLETKGMPDQLHYKIRDGEVVDYYFAEIKASTSLRESQLKWMKEHSDFPIKVIFTR